MNSEKPNILYIDNDDCSHPVSDGLELLGYKTIDGRSHREATEILEKERIDIVITEIKFMDASPQEIESFLRKCEGKGLPVIIFTTNTPFPLRNHGLPEDLKDVEIVRKPTSVRELRRAIERSLEKRHPRALSDDLGGLKIIIQS